MKIYISGISGTGMGPLALMAKAAGITVFGSDLAAGAVYDELTRAGIQVSIGEQDGEFLKEKLAEGVDWFVYTSALPETHAELVLAREAGIKCSKRDELTAFLVEKLGLKMVAVAGTHGKTTTTAMIVFAALKLGLPISYIVGTTLGFAPSGSYKEGDQYFIYEADEYDRNFLKYHPWLSVFTVVSYDHPDIYPTKEDYLSAFLRFEEQSGMTIREPVVSPDMFKIAGEVRRKDAALALSAILKMAPEVSEERIIEVLNEFPGIGRRFERVFEGIYSDYAHHPEEIEATIDVAQDEARMRGMKGVVVVYQPHQNTRQHEVRGGYIDAFQGADKILWLPTYLTRENPDLPILSAEELIAGLSNREKAEAVQLDAALFEEMMRWRDEGYLVVLMTAGPADGWLREKLGIL
ncbi:MAG: Mur ligase domain-containing protein [Candidatus Saccharibacteria bacterium]|nr:Mur ligase domain-containing protein [Candidatus Saccharibacteria bacterium]